MDASQVEDETAHCDYSINNYPRILFAGILEYNGFSLDLPLGSREGLITILVPSFLVITLLFFSLACDVFPLLQLMGNLFFVIERPGMCPGIRSHFEN